MIRNIIQYFRSCFCNHDWELISYTKKFFYPNDTLPCKLENVYRCKKCGFAQRVKF